MSRTPRDLGVIVAARRSPIGTAGHGLARVDAASLLAPVLAALVEDVRELGLFDEVETVDEVIAGNCLGPGGDIARVAALAAGLGVATPAVTVDRQCGSGQEAVHAAAARIALGAGLVLAGGVESASTAPWRLARPTSPAAPPRLYERAPFTPKEFGDPDMGVAADDLARLNGVSRQRQDAYAARSHARCAAAIAAGVYDDELVPVGGLVADERPRALSVEVLARLRPAFTAGGSVTAGNCCGISDGAAALAVVPEQTRARCRLPGLAIRGLAAVGVDPRLPGLGPVPAVERLLREAGLGVDDIDVWEITEAFAAQVLACTDALGLDPLGAHDARVCPDGGAIALGHPWGASGALLLVRLFTRLVRSAGSADGDGAGRAGGRYGVATCAIGGGQGLAMLVETVG